MSTTGNVKRTFIVAAILLVIIVLIKVATFFPGWIEYNYSTGVYPNIAWVYRNLFGKLGVSVGDILYLAAGILLCIGIAKFVRFAAKRRFRGQNLKRKLLKIFIVSAAIYIFFNLSWGLNYNRLGIAYQLKLDEEEHTVADLKTITALLLAKVNEDRAALGRKVDYPAYATVFNKAQIAYQKAAIAYPFITYNAPSVKRSLYGRMGSLLGFLGYFNPFTGEAQVNLTQPKFLVPFITCHEMAHQLGYASESEANFVGYMAATSSKETQFKYSAHFDLFNYANRELYLRDSLSAKDNYRRLDTLVKIDVAELKEYLRRSNNVIEPFIRIFYDQYLKANQQDKGIKSYSEVVSWLIAYHKKYHRL
jgi:hypothetical protein